MTPDSTSFTNSTATAATPPIPAPTSQPYADCAPYHRCLHACPKGLLRVAGESWDAEKLAEKLARDKELYDMSGGGVTLSGGEVLSQPDFAAELLDRLGACGIHRAIETAGYAPPELFQKIAVRCDFVYCDLKLADDALHRRYTGVSNAPILENIAWLRQSGIPYRLRTPLIPGYTDTEENLSAIRAMTKAGEVEYLPYNRLAGAKRTPAPTGTGRFRRGGFPFRRARSTTTAWRVSPAAIRNFCATAEWSSPCD